MSEYIQKERKLTRTDEALDAIATVLREIGWNPERDGESAGFVVRFDPPYIPVAYAYAVVSEQLETFLFHITLGVAAAVARRDETAKYLTLVNWNLMTGSFDMDYEDGQIRFRSAVCFRGTELSETLVRNVIGTAMAAVERYAEGAIDVMAREKPAPQAFEDAQPSEDSSTLQ